MCDFLAQCPRTMCNGFVFSQLHSPAFLAQSKPTALPSAPAWELAPSGAYLKVRCDFSSIRFHGCLNADLPWKFLKPGPPQLGCSGTRQPLTSGDPFFNRRRTKVKVVGCTAYYSGFELCSTALLPVNLISLGPSYSYLYMRIIKPARQVSQTRL